MIRMLVLISPLNPPLLLRSRTGWTFHNIKSSKHKQHFEDGSASKINLRDENGFAADKDSTET
jgi:hypothetical protein